MEKDTYSLKVLNAENIEPDLTAPGHQEDHDDSNHVEHDDSASVHVETNEKDQEDDEEDQDNTGAFFSHIHSTYVMINKMLNMITILPSSNSTPNSISTSSQFNSSKS